MMQNNSAYITAEHFRQRITGVQVSDACRAVGVLTHTFDNYFQGNMSLFEKSFLNIKVSLSEDTLDNFKVL